jgi:hypothetical protein
MFYLRLCFISILETGAKTASFTDVYFEVSMGQPSRSLLCYLSQIKHSKGILKVS